MLMNTHKRRIQEFFSCGLFLSVLICVDLWFPPVPASAVMKLVEQGKIRLNDPVARYIPEFAGPGDQGETHGGKKEGKDQVTIRHLLTHTAGLAPVPRVPEGTTGAEPVLNAIYEEP